MPEPDFIHLGSSKGRFGYAFGLSGRDQSPTCPQWMKWPLGGDSRRQIGAIGSEPAAWRAGLRLDWPWKALRATIIAGLRGPFWDSRLK